MKKNIFAILTLLFTVVAFAQEHEPIKEIEENITPIVMPETYQVKSGDTRIIPLPRYTFIDRLTFEVKTSLFCGSGNFKMSFDGYSMRTVDFASGFNGYKTKIITADARTRTLEIYNTSNCSIYVKGITILPRRWQSGQGHHPVPGGHHGGYFSEASAQVSFLFETLIYLNDLVSDHDRVTYLSPGKKVIGRALAVLNNTPETSQASLTAIKEVLDYLKMIRPLVDHLSTIETTFEVAQEIQSTEAALERMIR